MKKVYEHIASILQAARVCRERSEQPLGGDAERWYRRHTAALSDLLTDTLPHGSGFDSGVTLDYERTNEATQIVFDAAFHAMNDTGYYVGWLTYRVVATPAFVGGFDLDIELIDGFEDEDFDFAGTLDHVGETMHEALSADFTIPGHYYAEGL